MLALTAPAVAVTEVKRSRFIAEAFPLGAAVSGAAVSGATGSTSADLAAEARTILRAQKVKFADASHVVHAFIAGDAGEVRGMSDDGEPGGTAGRPVLDALAGSGCTNVLVTVTRYFGGTLLGTGGLARAYAAAAKAVLAAASTAPLVRTETLTATMTYPAYEKAARALTALNSPHTAAFSESVTLTTTVPTTTLEAAKKILANFTLPS
jgi:uncharacterized YigZ family protein